MNCVARIISLIYKLVGALHPGRLFAIIFIEMSLIKRALYFLFIMIIHWYGHACFKLQSNQNDVIVAIDPYDNSLGWRAPRLTADIAILSTQRGDHSNLEAVKAVQGDAPFVIQYPGEYEIGGVFVHAIPIGQGKNTTLLSAIRMDECSFVHLGALDRMLSEKELEELGNVDIVCIPVGGGGTLDAKKANELISELEPRIVIPMQYKVAGLKKECGTIDAFLKEYGVKDVQAMDKLKMLKKDLPADKTEVILLNPA